MKRESSRCDKKVWDIWDEQVVVVEVAVNFSIPTTILCMTYSVMGNESPGSSAAAFSVVLLREASINIFCQQGISNRRSSRRLPME